MSDHGAIFTLNGVVEAPEPDVARLLLTVHPGPVRPDNAFSLYQPTGPKLALRGGPDTFTGGFAELPDGLHVEVDRTHQLIAVQGQWWFRSETRVEPHVKGARVVQQVFNVAANRRWLVPMIWLTSGPKHRAGAHDLLRRIGARLNCRAYAE